MTWKSSSTPQGQHFTPLLKRWTVEQVYGWLMLRRRPARDDKALSACSDAMIHLATAGLMTRRFTDEHTIS
ncbi:hypothetical protein ACIF8T_40030 [Streptomyces sp. NPDC085946]|uniref:hypothetical protein n=1 Tax=Streptomyces sp. NPDC085946 TaxID=3365744 RepID=UPI0037CE991F